MAELFIELFSEEIPAKLQIDAEKNNSSYELPKDLSAGSILETANKLYEFVEGS